MFGGVEKSFKELNSSIEDLSKSLPPLLSPFLTTKEVDYAQVEKEMMSAMAERKLVTFMDECHLRTKEMGDSEKCEYCKLRFRCYTEATDNKRQDAKAALYGELYGQHDTRVTRPSKPKKRGKRG